MGNTSVIDAGDRAPPFALPDQDGNKVKLSDFKGRWVVLYFYPKNNTPGCTIEANEFTSHLKKFDRLEAAVLGVSPDSTGSHQEFISRYEIKFLLLSDPDHEVMKKYGAFGLKKMYGKETRGVIRSTFLIDPKGTLVHAWYKVKAAGHAEKVHQKLTDLATPVKRSSK